MLASEISIAKRLGTPSSGFGMTPSKRESARDACLWRIPTDCVNYLRDEIVPQIVPPDFFFLLALLMAISAFRSQLRLRLRRPSQAGCGHRDRSVSRRLSRTLPQPIRQTAASASSSTTAPTSPNCNYNYANTRTAPGHATLFTGAYSNGHGIAANEWWDQKKKRMVTSVEDDATKLVGVTGEQNRRFAAQSAGRHAGR